MYSVGSRSQREQHPVHEKHLYVVRELKVEPRLGLGHGAVPRNGAVERVAPRREKQHVARIRQAKGHGEQHVVDLEDREVHRGQRRRQRRRQRRGQRHVHHHACRERGASLELQQPQLVVQFEVLGLREKAHRVQQRRLPEAKEQHRAPQQLRAHARVLLPAALGHVAARGTGGLDALVDGLHHAAEGLQQALAAAQHTHDDHDVDDVAVVEIEDGHCCEGGPSFMLVVHADSVSDPSLVISLTHVLDFYLKYVLHPLFA